MCHAEKLNVHLIRRIHLFALQANAGKIERKMAGETFGGKLRGPLKCYRGPPGVRGAPFENHCVRAYMQGWISFVLALDTECDSHSCCQFITVDAQQTSFKFVAKKKMKQEVYKILAKAIKRTQHTVNALFSESSMFCEFYEN